MDEIIELETEIDAKFYVVRQALERAKKTEITQITIDTDVVEALMSHYDDLPHLKETITA